MGSPIKEEDIRLVVRAFYARVREDDLLAPIFATRIQDDSWDIHEDHITDFWSSIFLKTKQFSGNPMRKHLALKGLTPEHFTRWLSLFKQTSKHLLPPEKAELLITMSRRIGESFQMGLAVHYENSGETDHPFKDFGIKK